MISLHVADIHQIIDAALQLHKESWDNLSINIQETVHNIFLVLNFPILSFKWPTNKNTSNHSSYKDNLLCPNYNDNSSTSCMYASSS